MSREAVAVARGSIAVHAAFGLKPLAGAARCRYCVAG